MDNVGQTIQPDPGAFNGFRTRVNVAVFPGFTHPAIPRNTLPNRNVQPEIGGCPGMGMSPLRILMRTNC